MSWLLTCCLLFLLHSSPSFATSCALQTIPIDVVVDIQKCICDANQSNEVCCSQASSQLDILQSNVSSLLDVIDDVLAGISNFDTFISQYDVLISIAELIDVNFVRSLVNTISSTESSFEHVSSLIDVDTLIDETIFSTVSIIDDNVQTITSLVDNLIAQDCASRNDALIGGLDQLSSSVEQLVILFQEISLTDNNIISALEGVDTKADSLQSSLDVLEAQGCVSRQDIIVSSLDQLQEQEASCCQQLSLQLFQLQEDMDSRLDRIADISLIERFIAVLSVVDLFEAHYISYIDMAESGFDYISSQLDVVTECAVTAVQAPITIVVPGNYCLSSDAAGDIVIASSGVALNLNNHALAGSITINAGLQDIFVGNGRINGAGVNYGIIVNANTVNVTLSQLYITNFLSGIVSLGSIGTPVSNIIIDQVTVAGCSLTGFQIQETSGILSNSLAFQNTDGGINIVNTNISCTIMNTRAVNNGTFGFQVQGGANFGVLSAAIYDSFAFGNSNSPGFIFSNCTMYAQNCIAQNNGIDGFFINNGSPATVRGVITNCKAMGNGRGGFNVINSGTVVRFVGNYSASNNVFAYGVNASSIDFNVIPYYWLYSNSSTATGYNNTNGDIITRING